MNTTIVLPPNPTSPVDTTVVQWTQLALTLVLYLYLILKEFMGRLHSSKCCGGSVEMEDTPATMRRASEASSDGGQGH